MDFTFGVIGIGLCFSPFSVFAWVFVLLSLSYLCPTLLLLVIHKCLVK